MTKPEFPFMNLDIGKLIGDLKLPNMNVEQLMQAQRRNIEALTQANKLAAEGFQAIAKRQSEILKETMDEMGKAMKDAMSGGTPEANAAKQADLAKQALERALANMKELAEMAAKANSEAFELINRRVMESLDELKVQLNKPKKT